MSTKAERAAAHEAINALPKRAIRAIVSTYIPELSGKELTEACKEAVRRAHKAVSPKGGASA